MEREDEPERDSQDPQRLDQDKVDEARWRLANGYYEALEPHLMREAAERLLRAFRNAE